MQTINTDSAQGIGVGNGSAYFSLGSPLWRQCTEGSYAKATYSYAPPSQGSGGVEMATMNMARWDKKDESYQAFYFQPLKFTPSSRNKITRIGS